jgi:DNA-binding IclR family transcriptional regulator
MRASGTGARRSKGAFGFNAGNAGVCTEGTRAANGGKNRNFIEPLARGLSILQAFTPQDRWLGNQEIAARVNLPNATVNRLMNTLTKLGYLSISPRRRQYRLAAPVLGLGYAAGANNRVRLLMRSHMQQMADQLNVFTLLGERHRLDIVLLDVCHSSSSILTLRLDQGSRVPMAETALGWALMSALPPTEKAYLFTHMKEKYLDRWPAVENRIKRAFSQIEANGYCVSLGAWRSEISTAAIPLLSADQSSVVVLGCAAPAPYLPINRMKQEIGPALLALTKQMRTELPSSGS